MFVCEEMQKLRDWLDQNSIQWLDVSDDFADGFWICRTHFYIDEYKVSVINGSGTYGGFIFGKEQSNAGLLEVWADRSGEPVGYLTAEDAIQLLKDKYHMEEIYHGVEEDISITLFNQIAKEKTIE